jgi:hypothetical protein
MSYASGCFSYYKEYILAFSNARNPVQMKSNPKQIYNPLSHNNTKNWVQSIGKNALLQFCLWLWLFFG